MAAFSPPGPSDGSTEAQRVPSARSRRAPGSILRANVWRTGIWVAVTLLAVGALIFTLREPPGSMRAPFQAWYGHWRSVALASLLFLAFLFGFAAPRRRAEWRNAGLGSAFFILGFNIHWPTLLTLLMAHILVAVYVRLARQEDRELAAEFGEPYRAYGRVVPAFLPGRRRTAVGDLTCVKRLSSDHRSA